MSVSDVPTTELLKMPEAPFRDIVNAALRKQLTPAQRKQLYAPRVIDRYLETLREMHDSVENQFAAKASELQARLAGLEALGDRPDPLTGKPANIMIPEVIEADVRWRDQAQRFRTILAEELGRAKRARRERETSPTASSARERALVEAIRRHRDGFPPDDEPSENDYALWAVID